jgi:hypothetical protein
MKKRGGKIRKVSCASVLISFTLVLVTSISTGAVIPDQNMHNGQTSPWGSLWIDVYTQEKYGPKDNPQYRPLGNVYLTLWGCGIFIWPISLLSFLKWRHDGEVPPSWSDGPTTNEGYWVIPHIYLGVYRLFASKEGYVDLHYKWGVVIKMNGNPGSATCTLTAKGSAWDPQSRAR